VLRQGTGLVFGLLAADPHGWFAAGRREPAIREAFAAAVAELAATLGDPATWAWGRLHTVTLRHPLGRRPNLTTFVDVGPRPADGDGHTLNNQHVEATGSYESTVAACGRIAAEPASGALRMVNIPGNSGHPGSPHYGDQFEDWLAGRLREMDL
jgi:penicillin amidase